MNASGRPQRGLLRAGVVAVLPLAAFFTALPWLGCAWNPVTHVIDMFFLLGVCTFGPGLPPISGNGLPGFAGPYWGYLVVSIAYLIAAIFAAVTKRSL